MVYLPKYTYSMQDGNAMHSIILIGMKRGWQWVLTSHNRFYVAKEIRGFILKQMELQHYHMRKHLNTTTFHWTFFIATQQRGISYLLTSYAIHHFSIHNSYFTRRPLMLSWSIWSYQGPRREGCYWWAIPWSNNRCSMESTIMVSPTLCPHHYSKHRATTCGPILCLHLSQEHDTGATNQCNVYVSPLYYIDK